MNQCILDCSCPECDCNKCNHYFPKLFREQCGRCKFMHYDDRSPEMCNKKELEKLGFQATLNHFIPYCSTILEKQNYVCKYYKFSLFALLGIGRG